LFGHTVLLGISSAVIITDAIIAIGRALLGLNHKNVALYLPGQADSNLPANGNCMQRAVVMVHGLLQKPGINRYFLAAHDLGAWITYPPKIGIRQRRPRRRVN
jgi:hypothetical protein